MDNLSLFVSLASLITRREVLRSSTSHRDAMPRRPSQRWSIPIFSVAILSFNGQRKARLNWRSCALERASRRGRLVARRPSSQSEMELLSDRGSVVTHLHKSVLYYT